MGYRFHLSEIKYVENVKIGERITVTLKIENLGVAPIYNALPVWLRIVGKDQDWTHQTNIDVKQWLPGQHIENVSILLPKNLNKGTYDVKIAIGGDSDPSVRFATDVKFDGRWHTIGKIYLE